MALPVALTTPPVTKLPAFTLAVTLASVVDIKRVALAVPFNVNTFVVLLNVKFAVPPKLSLSLN